MGLTRLRRYYDYCRRPTDVGPISSIGRIMEIPQKTVKGLEF